MSTVPLYFKDFLSNIRLTVNQQNDLITGHKTLRNRLEEDDELSKIIIGTFLQGSYRRATAVKPKNGNRSDVDVIVVTNLDSQKYTPQEALNLFKPFLEKYYQGKYRMQGRSIGIELSYVDLDIVPTSAPSESVKSVIKSMAVRSDCSVEDLFESATAKEFFAEASELNEAYKFFSKAKDDPQWKLEPLLIPDCEANSWENTNPLEQIRWTQEKNKNCNGHYVNVVKAIKWWKKVNLEMAKHPKSYPLEHFIGDCCPNNVSSVAEGIVKAFETIVSDYPVKPFLSDRGVQEHDVFKRLTEDDYNIFYAKVSEAAILAREALDSQELSDSVEKWRKLFGSEFPSPPNNKGAQSNSGFTPRTVRTENVPNGRFAY